MAQGDSVRSRDERTTQSTTPRRKRRGVQCTECQVTTVHKEGDFCGQCQIDQRDEDDRLVDIEARHRPRRRW